MKKVLLPRDQILHKSLRTSEHLGILGLVLEGADRSDSLPHCIYKSSQPSKGYNIVISNGHLSDGSLISGKRHPYLLTIIFMSCSFNNVYMDTL